MNRQINQTELKILIKLVEDPFKDYSISDISRQIKSSYRITYDSVKSLVKKEYISIRRIGNGNILTLLLDDFKPGLFQAEEQRKAALLKKHFAIARFTDDINKKIKDNYFTLLIFGSYASGDETKNSDIDVLCIMPSSDDVKKIDTELHAIVGRYPGRFHIITVDAKSFIEMLYSRKDVTNVAREILNKHVILLGIEQYYKLVGDYYNARRKKD